MEEDIAIKRERLVRFKKEHGNSKVGDVTVNAVIGGMRGMMGLIYETSKLHPTEGINYRGHTLMDIEKQAPKAPGGTQPLPEAVLWLLLTGHYPDEHETKMFVEELERRGRLTP